MSEEGFLFLTERSDFWRSHQPIYTTLGEKEKRTERRKRHSIAVGLEDSARRNSKALPKVDERNHKRHSIGTVLDIDGTQI